MCSYNLMRNIIYLDGHFKIVEKHLSGLSFGIGENGKLWILTPTNNVNLDSYNGKYMEFRK